MIVKIVLVLGTDLHPLGGDGHGPEAGGDAGQRKDRGRTGELGNTYDLHILYFYKVCQVDYVHLEANLGHI